MKKIVQGAVYILGLVPPLQGTVYPIQTGRQRITSPRSAVASNKPSLPRRSKGLGLVPPPRLGVLCPPPEGDGPADEPPSNNLVRAPPQGKAANDPTNERQQHTVVKNSSAEIGLVPPARHSEW